MEQYLATIMSWGADYAYRELANNLRLSRYWRGLTGQGREKALAALVGFASRHGA